MVPGTDARWPQRELAAEGPFRVLDSAFSAILARACRDLAELADELGEPRIAVESAERSERVSAALRARARSDGLIPPVDLRAETALEAPSAGLALTLLAPGLESRTIHALKRLLAGPLGSPFGVRSLARDAEGWSPRCYWRGPVWANVSWLCALGLEWQGEREAAESLGARMLRAAESGGMREYFAPDSGRGLGARRFSWTAALTLRELARDTGSPAPGWVADQLVAAGEAGRWLRGQR